MTAGVGDPLVDGDVWAALVQEVPACAPDAVAVEGWPGEGVSVAAAWRLGTSVVVRVADLPDVAAAGRAVALLGCRVSPIVGASLAGDPVWRGRVESRSQAVRASISDLSGLLRDGVLRHDGADHLTNQVLALRVTPSADGQRVRSTGRADAAKAAVWAVGAARAGRGMVSVLLPRGL